MEDIDLNLEDFVNKVNSNLVGKYVNIISRISGFILNIFDGKIVIQKNLTYESKLEKKINEKFDSYLNKIETGYESRNTSRVVRDLTALMDSVNTYIEENKPWVLAKKINQDFESNKEKIVYLQSFHETLSFCVHCFAKLTILIKPILPSVSAKIEKEIFNLSRPFSWDDLNNLNISSIKPIDHLISRIHIRDLSKLRRNLKMFKKHRRYKSEISIFLSDLQCDAPEIEKQKSGRSLLWDRPERIDDNNETSRENKIEQSSYVYF